MSTFGAPKTLVNPRCREVRERLREAMKYLDRSDVESPNVGIYAEMIQILNQFGWLTMDDIQAALKFIEAKDLNGFKTFIADIEAKQKEVKKRNSFTAGILEKQEEVTTRLLDYLGDYLDISGLAKHGIDEPTGLLMEERAIKEFEKDPEVKLLFDEIKGSIRGSLSSDGAELEGEATKNPPFKLEYDLQVFEDEQHRAFGVLVAEFTWENNEKPSLPFESFVRVSKVQHIELPQEQDILEHDKKLLAERAAKAPAKTADPTKDRDMPFPPELLERMRAGRRAE